jgi:hypothetical protein
MAFGALVATMDMATRAAPTELSDSVTAAAVGTVSGAVALPAAVDPPPCPPEFCGSTCDVACYAAYDKGPPEVDYSDQIQGCTFADDTCEIGSTTVALCNCTECC